MKRQLSMLLALCLLLALCPMAALGAQQKPVYLEDLKITASDRYAENEGDSFIGPLGTRNGKTDVYGNEMQHGLEAWIARWNYTAEQSWAWADFALGGKYKTLEGRLTVVGNSHNHSDYS